MLRLPRSSARHWLAAGGGLCVVALTITSLLCFASTQPAAQPVPSFSLFGKSVYFLLVDRFARPPGATTASNSSDVCFGHNTWCGGSLAGVVEQLDYIAGMGLASVRLEPT